MDDIRTATAAHLEADETHRLISSEKVDGTAVYDRRGERLGSVHHLMIDKYTGQVAYAVMSFGGFLGIGESYYPLPWKMLTYDIRLGGYVVDLDRNRLEGAPATRRARSRIGTVPTPGGSTSIGCRRSEKTCKRRPIGRRFLLSSE
jgi:sporulation protein YlmC with PRC-barrel domain